MAELFNPDLPRLKLFFLQLDRMLCLVDADLYNHFNNEGITSSYFASAWFITLYTNSLKQNTDAGVVNENLLQLWDFFLLSGWKAIVKLGLYILTMDSQQFLTMSFEKILTHISDSPKMVLEQQDHKQTLY
jgi:Rab-GTPase-TBC domain